MHVSLFIKKEKQTKSVAKSLYLQHISDGGRNSGVNPPSVLEKCWPLISSYNLLELRDTK